MATFVRTLVVLVLVLVLAACSRTPPVELPPTLSEAVAEEATLTSFAALVAALDLDLDDPWIIGELPSYTLTAPSNDALDVYAETFLGANSTAADLLALIATLDPDSEAMDLIRLFVIGHFVPGVHDSEQFVTAALEYQFFYVWWYEDMGDDCSYTYGQIYYVFDGTTDDAYMQLYPYGYYCGSLNTSFTIELEYVEFSEVDIVFDRGLVHIIDTFDVGAYNVPFGP